MTRKDFEAFETTLTKSNTRVVMAYTPFDKQFVDAMRQMGARFATFSGGRKGWWVRADGTKVERFRAACAAAADRPRKIPAYTGPVEHYDSPSPFPRGCGW